MRDSERRVVEVILGAPDVVADSSVSEVARLAGTATSTVVRACKSAGFSGFHEVKLGLLSDLALRRPDPLTQLQELGTGTTPEETVRVVMRLSAAALESAAATVDAPAFARVVSKISSASRILVVGLGTSMAPAQDAAYRLRILGFNATAPSDSYSLEIQASQLDGGAVCLVVSHSGATKDSLLVAQTAKQVGAYVALISSFMQSPIAELADAVLVAGGPKQGFRLESMSSRLCHLALIDALFVTLAIAYPDWANQRLDVAARVTAGRLV